MTAEKKGWDIYTLSSISGALWLFVCINPFILWLTPQSPWYMLAFGLVFLSTIQFIRSNTLEITPFRILLAMLVLFFCAYLFLAYMVIGHIFQFSPFLMLAFWNDRAAYGVYRYFRYVILFFSACALINWMLIFIGITIPYISMSGMSSAHYLSDTTLRIHGLTVTATNLATEMNDSLVRICGPLQEGGHFGIILGTILIIDNFVRPKINKVLLITGILTFSPAFLILLLSVCTYNLLTCKHLIIKRIIAFLGIATLISVVVSLLPDRVVDSLVYSVYERNLGTVVETALEQKSLVDALSERSTIDGEYLYSQFQKSDTFTKLFGVGEIGNEIVLSDFRCSILRLGYVGFSLLLLLGLFCISCKTKKVMVIMAIPFLLVLIHRSWMLDSTYVHYLCFCGISVYNYISHNRADLESESEKSATICVQHS